MKVSTRLLPTPAGFLPTSHELPEQIRVAQLRARLRVYVFRIMTQNNPAYKAS